MAKNKIKITVTTTGKVNAEVMARTLIRMAAKEPDTGKEKETRSDSNEQNN